MRASVVVCQSKADFRFCSPSLLSSLSSRRSLSLTLSALTTHLYDTAFTVQQAASPHPSPSPSLPPASHPEEASWAAEAAVSAADEAASVDGAASADGAGSAAPAAALVVHLLEVRTLVRLVKATATEEGSAVEESDTEGCRVVEAVTVAGLLPADRADTADLECLRRARSGRLARVRGCTAADLEDPGWVDLGWAGRVWEWDRLEEEEDTRTRSGCGIKLPIVVLASRRAKCTCHTRARGEKL